MPKPKIRPFRTVTRQILPLLLLAAAPCACMVRMEAIQRGKAYLEAKALDYNQIAAWFDTLTRQHDTFIVKNATLTFSAESDKLLRKERFPSASGVILLDRNGDLRLQIYAPVIKTTLVDIVSKDGRFSMWYPRNKTLYKGSVDQDLTNVSVAVSDASKAPRYNLSKLRPMHLTQTFFHSRLSPQSSLAVIQDAIPEERYYIVFEMMPARSPGEPSRILQAIYMERSSLRIRRKILYDENGQAVCDIRYGNTEIGGYPDHISMRRPVEGYEVQLQIRKVQVDTPLTAEMLDLTVPEDAVVKAIGEKD
ncbi:MAG: hypothetical protein KA419_04315 [Acidobacteria bacterium]|nr:hypothetical protein [Acidobacteriota bacterium]